jgi:hypothetical protein
MLTETTWTDEHTKNAIRFWEEYQAAHDVSAKVGQTVGIDPMTGEVWFGKSALDIVDERDAAGKTSPLYFVRVGKEYYVRKGGRA